YFPFEGARLKDEFERLKREVAPDLILTHARDDAHQDHRMVSDLTHQTWRSHLILEYEIPKSDGDLGSLPFFVALDEPRCRRKVETRLASFRRERGRGWFTRETFLALLRLRGVQATSPSGFAEAFHCRRLLF